MLSDNPDRFEAMHALVHNTDLELIMEAHDGLSAKIVEKAGFKGI